MSNKKLAFTALFLALAVAIFLSRLIFSFKTGFIRDLTYIFQPWRTYGAEMLITGKMPLWNPYCFSGMPFLANWQSAIFYPFNIFFYVFPFYAALKFYYYINLFIAGFFTYLFARKIKLSIIASAGMMIVFTFSGFLITKLEFLSHIGVDVWSFALFLFINNPVILAITAVISFSSGHQIFAYQILVLIAFAVVYKPYNTIKNMVLALLVALGLSAVQLLPLLELMKSSSRLISGINQQIAMLYSLNISDLIKIVYPLYHFNNSELVIGEKYLWVTAGYVGIVASIISFLGLFSTRNIKSKFVPIILIIIGFTLALGNSTPVYPWLYKNIIIFKTMRYPGQFVFISLIGLTILCGYGFDYLSKYVRKYLITVLLCMIYFELMFYGQNFQPFAGNDYYYNKHKAVQYLQNESATGRFILSPGTEQNRHINANNVEDAWQKMRGCLYNLTSMPYHLFNAYGFGEPLTLKNIEDLVDNAYKQKKPQDLLPFLNTLGVNYLLCRNKLENFDGYELVYSGNIYLYKTVVTNTLYNYNSSTVDKIEVLKNIPGKIIIETQAKEPSSILWKEAFMPGWKAYSWPFSDIKAVHSAEIIQADNIFRRIECPSGKSMLIQYYDPLSYRSGVLISVFFILILTSIYYLKLRNYE
jgi:hypothetical protein